ncbi:MAG: ATP-binding protein [Candidatus Omnitrophota bacterium]
MKKSQETNFKFIEPYSTVKYNKGGRVKPAGKGIGLGLAMVYNIIQKHKGEVSLKSRVGIGTIFIVRLPQGEAL